MNKQDEQKFVEFFLSNLHNYKDGNLIPSESPDFLLKFKDRIIGIEVTRIFKNTEPGEISLQAKEAEQNILVSEAMKLYEKKHKIKLDVQVIFGSKLNTQKKDRKNLSKIIYNKVKSNIPADNSAITITNDFEDEIKFPYVISHIRIANFQVLERNNWTVPGAGWIQTDCIDVIQNSLTKKLKKMDGYKERCDSCWLLIVSDSNYISSSCFNPSIETKNHKYDFLFDKVFCMWDWFGDFFELTSRRSV